jgi:hypothetical protein
MKKKELAERLDRFANQHLNLDTRQNRMMTIAQERYDQAERLLRQAERLVDAAKTRLEDLDRRNAEGEAKDLAADRARLAREETFIEMDPAKIRDTLRQVGVILGLEELGPGRFPGGHAAVIREAGALVERVRNEGKLGEGARHLVWYLAARIGIAGAGEPPLPEYVGSYGPIVKRIDQLLDAEEKAYLLTAFYNAVCDATVMPASGSIMQDADAATVRARLFVHSKNKNIKMSIREALSSALRADPKTVKATEKAVTEAASVAVQAARAVVGK